MSRWGFRPRVSLGFLAALGVMSVMSSRSPVATAMAAAPDDRPAGLANVGLEQKLNAVAPLDASFRDENGHVVRLGDYFGRVPVILTLNYYECPMLCPLVLNDLLRAIRAISLNLGTDFNILTISINPEDTPAQAAEKKHWYVERYRRAGGAEGWHFLTGDSASIGRLARAVGFQYDRDPQTGQYAHVAGLIIATPEGRLSRYFFGLEYSARDLRLGLVDASNGRIGSLADQFLLFCFHYDDKAGRYNFAVLRAVRAGGVLTVFGLGTLMTILFRRERRESQGPRGPAGSKQPWERH